MGSVITGIAYSNSMDMGTCCIGRIGICAITITTAGNTSVRFVRTTKGKCMWMISCRVCASSMCMFWKFSDRLLCCSTPTINRYIRLQVIVWIIRASVTNSYGMSMCTSLFGCFCALIRTPWSWSRFCTTCVVFFYKSKSMRVIPACTNRYIVVMFRQFSDSSLCRPAPAINSNVWLHYIVTLAVSCIRNSKCMSMTACRTSFSIVKVIFCIVVSWMTVNRT